MKLTIKYKGDRVKLEVEESGLPLEELKRKISTTCFPGLMNFKLSLNGREELRGADLAECGIISGDLIHLLTEATTHTSHTPASPQHSTDSNINHPICENNNHPINNQHQSNNINLSSNNHDYINTNLRRLLQLSATQLGLPNPPSKSFTAIQILLQASFLADSHIHTRGFFPQGNTDKDTAKHTDKDTKTLTYKHKDFENKMCYFLFLFVPLAHYTVIHGFLKEQGATVDYSSLTINNTHFMHTSDHNGAGTSWQMSEGRWEELVGMVTRFLSMPLLQAARELHSLSPIPTLNNLPSIVLIKILKYLSAKDLLNFSLVDGGMRKVVVEEGQEVWSHLLKIHFPAELHHPRDNKPAYERYKETHREKMEKRRREMEMEERRKEMEMEERRREMERGVGMGIWRFF